MPSTDPPGCTDCAALPVRPRRCELCGRLAHTQALTAPPLCLQNALSLVAYGGGGTSDTSKLPYYLSVTGAPGNTIFGVSGQEAAGHEGCQTINHIPPPPPPLVQVAAFGSDNCQGTPTNATFFNLQGDSFEVDPTSTFSQNVGSFFVCGATSG